jgi:5-methyltetrahydrofolate--homocysteine methyltransferase
MDWMEKIGKGIVKGRKKGIATAAIDAVRDGVSASALVDEAIIPAMNTVSELWRDQEYYLPEVMRSAETMQAAMDALKPYLVGGEHGKAVRVSIGTVKGDIHDIGKNLVAIMLEGAGFQIENMGVDLPPERFLEAVRQGADVIGISSLLTTSMGEMRTIVDCIEAGGLRDRVRILVGGAPVTEEYAKSIGADYYANNAAEAVEVMNKHFA